MSKTQIAARYANTPLRKNLFINGSFQVFQQRVSGNGIASGSTVGDMWKIHNTTSAVLNFARTSGNSIGPAFYGVDIWSATADTSIAAGVQSHLSHRIEGRNVAHLRQGSIYAETVTLSFWHLHTEPGTYCVAFANNKKGLSNRVYVAEYEQTVATTWEHATITVPLDQAGTWSAAEGVIGLEVRFVRAAGSDFYTTAGSWQTGDYLCTSNQTNGYASTNALNRIAGAQLEIGTIASELEIPTLPEELALCQRYWEKSYDYDIAAGSAAKQKGMDWNYHSGGMTSAAQVAGKGTRFEVQKCKWATVTGYSPSTGASGYARDFIATTADVAVTISDIGFGGFRWYATSNGSKAQFSFALQWTASAEL